MKKTTRAKKPTKSAVVTETIEPVSITFADMVAAHNALAGLTTELEKRIDKLEAIVHPQIQSTIAAVQHRLKQAEAMQNVAGPLKTASTDELPASFNGPSVSKGNGTKADAGSDPLDSI